MSETLKIFKIKLKLVFNNIRKHKKINKQRLIRTLILGSVSLFFLIGVYVVFVRILTYFNEVPLFGSVLIMRLLAMVFLTFFSMLVFSNIIVSISTIYLSDDINLLMAIPVKSNSIFIVKFFETLISSSWMVVLMGFPIWAAYAKVTNSGILFIPLATIIILPFLIISCCIGVFFTMVLMKFFSATKTKEIFILLSVGFFSVIVVLFRIIPPSKLTNPGEFTEIMQFLSTLKAPVAPYLPSYWATESLLSVLYKHWGSFFIYSGILLSTAVIFFRLILVFADKVFYLGWCNASYTHDVGKKRGFFERLHFEKLFSFFKLKNRAFIIKDIKIFKRDATQWPQLLLLVSIVIIYLFNVYHMSLQSLPIGSYFLRNLIFFLNMGFAGFIISAVAARFVFPSVSIEGKSFWIVKSSPVSFRKYLWGKFWTNLLPIFFFSELLIVLSIYFMKIDVFMSYLSVITVGLFSFGLTSLGIAIGSIYPKFEVDNPSEIATSWGGLIYMIWSIAYIGITLIIESGPVRLYYLGRLTKGNFNLTYVVICGFLLIVLNIIILYFPIRFGIKSLEKKEL